MAQPYREHRGQHFTLNSLEAMILWPGNAICSILKITDPNGQMLVRLFVNLSIYGKIGALIALMIA